MFHLEVPLPRIMFWATNKNPTKAGANIALSGSCLSAPCKPKRHSGLGWSQPQTKRRSLSLSVYLAAVSILLLVSGDAVSNTSRVLGKRTWRKSMRTADRPVSDWRLCDACEAAGWLVERLTGWLVGWLVGFAYAARFPRSRHGRRCSGWCCDGRPGPPVLASDCRCCCWWWWWWCALLRWCGCWSWQRRC